MFEPQNQSLLDSVYLRIVIMPPAMKRSNKNVKTRKTSVKASSSRTTSQPRPKKDSAARGGATKVQEAREKQNKNAAARKNTKTTLAPGAWVELEPMPPALVAQHFSTDHFKQLWALRPEEIHTVKMYGKEVPLKRRLRSYGHDYRFSNNVAKAPRATTSGGEEVRNPPWVQALLDFATDRERRRPGEAGGSESVQSFVFNQALVNWYENGSDCIGFHSDDQTQIVPGAPVYTVSLGAERRFLVRAKPRKGLGVGGETRKQSPCTREFPVTDGSVLVMGGENFQRDFQHSVPAQKRVEGARISVTLRCFNEA